MRFTVVQATVSALLSCLLALPVARALARRRFPGRGLVIALLGAPFILPVIVAILGLIAVFGAQGIVARGLGLLGLPAPGIYGAHGVVLAHVFFNLPLATRLVLQGWLSLPAERFRLAAALGTGRRGYWRIIEVPMLREVLPGAFLVIFLLCLTSFAVALTLGGGPAATTIELAIYEAFRFDVDLGRASTLGLLQVGLCAMIAAASLAVTVPQAAQGGLDAVVRRWDGGRIADAVAIGAASIFLLAPLAVLAARGVPMLPALPAGVWRAALTSVWVALVSTGATLVLALALMRAAGWLGDGLSALILATSPLVMGTGLFLILLPVANPVGLALPITVAVNAALALPFALRVMGPAWRATEATYGPLADSLGMRGWARWRWLVLPRLRRPMGFAAGLAAALSMGDLGVIALFSPERATLPLEMFRHMGAYRMEQAAGAALLLMALSLALFWAFDRGGRADAAV
ncbi:MAG: thiamine/thiamine pyrophosphate ABC transporter permease ThiP [Shimia sp.]